MVPSGRRVTQQLMPGLGPPFMEAAKGVVVRRMRKVYRKLRGCIVGERLQRIFGGDGRGVPVCCGGGRVFRVAMMGRLCEVAGPLYCERQPPSYRSVGLIQVG